MSTVSLLEADGITDDVGLESLPLPPRMQRRSSIWMSTAKLLLSL